MKVFKQIKQPDGSYKMCIPYNKFQTSDKVYYFDKEALVQSIRERCSIIYGEWYKDVSLGISLGRTKEIIDMQVQSIISNTLGVKSVISFSSKLDSNSRIYHANIDIISDYGEELTINI